MKKHLIAVLIALCALSVTEMKTLRAAETEKRLKPTAASVIAFALADVRRTRSEMMKNEKWSAPDWMKVKYVKIIFGKKDFVYNGNRRVIRTRKSKWPTAGIIGNYAEVSWELLDKDKNVYSDIHGQQVVKFDGRRWIQVAGFSSADGYGDQLEKAEVPAWIIKRIVG